MEGRRNKSKISFKRDEFSLRKLSQFFSLFLAVFVLSSCNFRNEKDRLDPLTGETWFASIQRTIIEPKCISCHMGSGAAMGVDLSSYTKIMESKSVIPFKPDQSKFFTTIESGRMPKGGARLSDSEIQRVFEWIEKGAPEGKLPEPTPEPVPQPTLASIQKDFVDRKCVSCHQEATSANRHVKLASLMEIVEGTGHPPGGAHVRKIIKPGCPKESFFHSIMREGKMPPPPAPKPTQEWLKAMSDWITSLKPGAICDDEPGGGDDGDEPL